MNVNHEIKSQLAKLLATEDLIVEHKHVETASFNVHDNCFVVYTHYNKKPSAWEGLVDTLITVHVVFLLDVVLVASRYASAVS